MAKLRCKNLTDEIGRGIAAKLQNLRFKTSLQICCEAAKHAVHSACFIMRLTSLHGQDAMKLRLILTIIDPTIRGVLLLGDRRTGKSTAVRALKSFLPDDTTLHGKKWMKRSVPLVELPLGATEDRLCRTIDLEKALQKGQKSFEPGLLSKANGGFLYVDEINLLDDHLIDLLLDAAASRWNTVERETISIQHPANFILVGSRNPEEGALRPQLLDRFGLNILVQTPQSNTLRMRIVQLILRASPCSKRTHQDPESMAREDRHFVRRMKQARRRRVSVSKSLRLHIAKTCVDLQIDRLRGDLVLTRAASAFAAWSRRNRVRLSDIEAVLPFCLNHRLKKDPLERQRLS